MTSPIPPSPSQIIRATDDQIEAGARALAKHDWLDWETQDDAVRYALRNSAEQCINAALKAMSLSATTDDVVLVPKAMVQGGSSIRARIEAVLRSSPKYSDADINRMLVALDDAEREPLPATTGEPVAWRYELLHGGWPPNDRWQWHLSESEPHVPEGTIRNLTPLYAQPLSATTPRVTGEPVEVIQRLDHIRDRMRNDFWDEEYFDDITDAIALIRRITPRQPDDGDAADLVTDLEGFNETILRKAAREIRDLRDRLAALGAERDEAKEQAHYANGVADLAMKHRDEAEQRAEKALADLASLRAALEGAIRILERRFGYNPRDAAPAFQAVLNEALSSLKTQEPAK